MCYAISTLKQSRLDLQLYFIHTYVLDNTHTYFRHLTLTYTIHTNSYRVQLLFKVKNCHLFSYSTVIKHYLVFKKILSLIVFTLMDLHTHMSMPTLICIHKNDINSDFTFHRNIQYIFSVGTPEKLHLKINIF